MSKISNVGMNVAGVTFNNEDGTSRGDIIGTMTANSPLILKRESHNLYDTNAVAVHTIDGQIGYIPRNYSEIIASMMDSGRNIKARVNEFGMHKGRPYCSIILDEE